MPVAPLALLEATVGSEVWIIMRGERELKGVLKGYDDYVNLVLEDVREFDAAGELISSSASMLLNGNNIVGISPGKRSD
jgi:U6 snRNA-associated Sm-like protein LSm5